MLWRGAQMNDELKILLERAFPDGDLDAHRRFHEQQVVNEKERRELWRTLRDKTLGAVVWAVIVAISTAVWQYFRLQVAL